MSKKYNKYSKEVELKAVDMYINEGISAVNVARTLNKLLLFFVNHKRVYTLMKEL